MPRIKKKKWVRPILTVITRGEDRSERVLLLCKYLLTPEYSAQNLNNQCQSDVCTDCNLWSVS